MFIVLTCFNFHSSPVLWHCGISIHSCSGNLITRNRNTWMKPLFVSVKVYYITRCGSLRLKQNACSRNINSSAKNVSFMTLFRLKSQRLRRFGDTWSARRICALSSLHRGFLGRWLCFTILFFSGRPWIWSSQPPPKICVNHAQRKIQMNKIGGLLEVRWRDWTVVATSWV